MNRICGRSNRRQRLLVFITAALIFVISLTVIVAGETQLTLVKVSKDTFKNGYSEHRSEVEPHTFAWGSTIVSAFQVARVFGGGGADIGFATSLDGGQTWTSGYLPGLTSNYKGGSFSAASDPAVAYDPKHKVWMISSLPVQNDNPEAVATSRSTDGINWDKPIIVDNSGSDDKNWIACDTTSTSPFYGNCYTEWDSPGLGDLIFMSTSTDGGLTWGPAKTTGDQSAGLGGQPLVQPNGTVVVPIDGFGGMVAFRSTNGGSSWTSTSLIGFQNFRGQDGGLRSPGLPSAAVDGAGKIYVVWPDCSFRPGCATDDIVMSTSTNGTTWTAVARIPIHGLSTTFDHFIPGLGVDPATSGATAHLAMTYYYYPKANCGGACQLYVGFTTSQDGGKTWTKGKELAGPMSLNWLAPSQNGQMTADYLAVAYSNGNPFGVFAVAKAPSGGLLNEAMYTTATPLLVPKAEPRISSRGEKPVPGVKGRFVWKYYDDDGEYPIPAGKLPPRHK